MHSANQTRLVLVDDHYLFRKGLIELINDFPDYQVSWESENGKDFTLQLPLKEQPEIVLLDITMPVMDGYETAKWLSEHYPQIKILALSMHSDEESILKMLQAGVDGYILKNADLAEMRLALDSLRTNGSYYTQRVTDALLKRLYTKQQPVVELTKREIEFLKLTCTELPYKAFGPFLNIHPRVVETIRETLFRKLDVTTRVGLVLYAIRHHIYKV